VKSDLNLVAVVAARLRRSASMAFAIGPSGARGQSPTNAGYGKLPTADGSVDSCAQGIVTVALQQRIELFHPLAGQTWLAVRDLGE
jgi:hypothetical protein